MIGNLGILNEKSDTVQRVNLKDEFHREPE